MFSSYFHSKDSHLVRKVAAINCVPATRKECVFCTIGEVPVTRLAPFGSLLLVFIAHASTVAATAGTTIQRDRLHTNCGASRFVDGTLSRNADFNARSTLTFHNDPEH
jgi:hypothetical protein